MTKTKDKIKALQQKYNVTASHPSGLQCKCIEGAVGHYNLELEKLIAESNKKYGLELLGVVLDRFVNVEAVAAATKDPVGDFYDVESFIRQLKSKVEKGESISLYAEKENGNDHIRDDTKMVESNREAYKKGAMDAIEAIRLADERDGADWASDYDDESAVQRTINEAQGYSYAVDEQSNKAKEFLESLKNNSVSEIPTDSSD